MNPNMHDKVTIKMKDNGQVIKGEVSNTSQNGIGLITSELSIKLDDQISPHSDPMIGISICFDKDKIERTAIFKNYKNDILEIYGVDLNK